MPAVSSCSIAFAAAGFVRPVAATATGTLMTGAIVGSSRVMPNQPGQGAHVANGSFVVSPDASGGGIGRALGEHALKAAAELGYRAMQFNLVVSTNERAIALWRSLGFETVGRLPGAFMLRGEEEVDALVMYRQLDASTVS